MTTPAEPDEPIATDMDHAPKADPTEAPPAKPARRRFQLIILAALLLVALWSAGWFAIRHYAEGRLAAIQQDVADQGGSFACESERISGFPFRFVLNCTPAAITLPDSGLSARVSAVEAIALAYNPTHLLAAAQGPLVLRLHDGLGVNAEWSAAKASLRVGLSGRLKRFSGVVDDLDISLESPDKLIAATDLKAKHGELHLLQADGDATALEIWSTAQGLAAMLPGAPALPTLNGDVHAILPGALPAHRDETVDPVAAWLAAGGEVKLDRLGVDVGGFMAVASGDLTVSPDGLVSGRVAVRVDQLDKLPDLIEAIRPGHRDQVARIIGPLAAFLKPVTVDGKTWRETTVTIKDGRATVGFIPLGTIPPLKLAKTAEG
ncbi:DUF2125 domain-containing protein [Kaistia dalseonensis]|uniref:DUF2125 domain-containing protein n=1 Tax=Kaistia dalseonensis TaxID=410840 RepID=A0ABU0H5M2_9HYPH|nr:DUF2125 domain-containing protein [Kaistia dalseonensis]MCX5494593.1 DUF2125 domain-containing protein [Kaistia dalseonensis]MDQ0437173.1 hypothetical protein [Kaistia dalseonensis]